MTRWIAAVLIMWACTVAPTARAQDECDDETWTTGACGDGEDEADDAEEEYFEDADADADVSSEEDLEESELQGDDEDFEQASDEGADDDSGAFDEEDVSDSETISDAEDEESVTDEALGADDVAAGDEEEESDDEDDTEVADASDEEEDQATDANAPLPPPTGNPASLTPTPPPAITPPPPVPVGTPAPPERVPGSFGGRGAGASGRQPQAAPLSKADQFRQSIENEKMSGPVTLYAGNLPPEYSDDDLRNLFAPFGTVASARIVRDPSRQNQSKMMGFVTMATVNDATWAESALHQSDVGGKTIVVNKTPGEGR